jgi:putative chitinase
MNITKEILQQLVGDLDDATADEIAAAFTEAMDWASISTPERVAAFLAQCAHESQGFSRLEENLNYSAQALLRCWPSHFSASEAQQYAHHPQAIANRAYADRMGNGPEESGDGWRYRGRGPIELTGKDNYIMAGQDLQLDLLDNPDQVASWRGGSYVAAWFWLTGGRGFDNPRRPDCNEIADSGDFIALTRRINGGLTGLAERQQYWAAAKQALGVA